ncbi:MAG: stage II sporulation protein R [Oscillospiraceae bacterium]|nr:stage II sporulation protein R [Oscillospiraceae bacterium]
MRKIIILLLLLAGTLCLILSAAAREQARLGEKLIRLRVVAASDSADDQTRKLAVRDRLLAVVSAQDWQTRDEASAWLRDHLDALEAAGREALPDGEALTLTFGETRCPARDYGSFALPAGDYLTLEARIGAGEGHNWWCVVYPTLCAVPSASVPSAAADGGLTAGEIALITQDTPAVKLRFRILDLLF